MYSIVLNFCKQYFFLGFLFFLSFSLQAQQNQPIKGTHVVTDTTFDAQNITAGWTTDTVFNSMKAAVYFLDGVRNFTYLNNMWMLEPAQQACIMVANNYNELRNTPHYLFCDVVNVKNFPDTVNGIIYEILGGTFTKHLGGTENYGTIIKSANSTYCWKRDHNGVVIPDWWENRKDSEKIQAAVNFSQSYGKISFVPREYMIDSDIYLDSLQHIQLDGNKAVLKAASGSTRNTTLASSYSSGTTTIQVANVPSSWQSGDILVLANGSSNNGTSGRSQIDSINGNTIFLKFPFTNQGGGNLGSRSAGTNVIKSLTIFRGRPSATEGTTDTEGANKGIIIENFIIDGNKNDGNELCLSWSVNNIISLHGRGSEVRSCRFINAPSEVITGHGINVHDNVFKDCNGSVLHLSAHDDTFLESFPSYFSNNTVINCNSVPYAQNGHNEGIISFSWNGGYAIIANNYLDVSNTEGGVIGSLQGYGSPNDREILILANNYCKGFPIIANGTHQTTTRSLEIIGNIFENCTALMNTVDNDISVKVCGNVQVGSTNFGISYKNSCEYQAIIDQSFGLGKNSLLNTTSYNNTAVGHYAMEKTTSGDFNVAIGTQAFHNNISGNRNIAIGTWSGIGMTQGDDNTLIGHWSRGSSTGGNGNTHIGVEAGRTNTGNGNVFIGFKSGAAYGGNDNLIIHNNDSTPPLIEGKFDDGLTINGDLKVGGSNFFRLPRVTNTQRNAMTGLLGGELIFNTTYNKIQIYDSSFWVDFY
jgi:hypothetical protein